MHIVLYCMSFVMFCNVPSKTLLLWHRVRGRRTQQDSPSRQLPNIFLLENNLPKSSGAVKNASSTSSLKISSHPRASVPWSSTRRVALHQFAAPPFGTSRAATWLPQPKTYIRSLDSAGVTPRRSKTSSQTEVARSKVKVNLQPIGPQMAPTLGDQTWVIKCPHWTSPNH